METPAENGGGLDPLLPLRRLLDPRAAPAARTAPLADAVNIPAAELSHRTHELPPRGVTIAIAGVDSQAAHAAAGALRALDRAATITDEWAWEAPQAAPQPGRLWRPTAFLEQACLDRSPGCALDLACGVGRDAVWLAARGWRVRAVDVLPDAIDRGRKLAATCLGREAIKRIAWEVADVTDSGFQRGLPAAAFDLITVFRFLDRTLMGRIAEWLRPGGLLLAETFTRTHRARHGRPRRAQLVLDPNEMPALARGLKSVAYSEAWRGEAHTARLMARRPG